MEDIQPSGEWTHVVIVSGCGGSRRGKPLKPGTSRGEANHASQEAGLAKLFHAFSPAWRCHLFGKMRQISM